MFSRLYEVINNAQKLNEGVIFLRIMQQKDIAEFTLDLNRFEQLFMNSVDKEGVELPSYSKLSEDLSFDKVFTYKGKSRRKTRGDSMFLFDEGDFYATFRLTATQDEMIIYADTVKEDRDLLMYGDIIGLAENSKNELVKKIKPLVLEETRRRILQGN